MLRNLRESDLPEAVRFSECLLGKPESQSYPLFQSPAEIEAEFRLRRIGTREFDSYAAFHDAHFGETYWNAARLRQEADAWYIFAYAPDGTIQGSSFMHVQTDTAEIFGFAFETAEHAKRAALPLLSHALQTALSENPAIESVVFFADENGAAILHAASACGFTVHSRYRLYESVL